MVLFITGSYPDSQEGIASAAKMLLDAMVNAVGKEGFILLTTNAPIIRKNIDNNTTTKYYLRDNWNLTKSNVLFIERLLDEYPITVIHMDYPGDLYGKTFFASFLPWIVHRYNKKRGKKISINVRLHEFTKARFLRKMAILPILLCADSIYVPAMKDRETVRRIAGKRVHKTKIGTNIMTFPCEVHKNEKTMISYFGSVYPGKGIEKMLSLWKKIHDNDTKNVYCFKIIGEIGVEEGNHFREYHKYVWNLIDEMNLRDVIEVTGFISEEDVSKEIQMTDIATLFYEDGLTLRRGSFLAYLAHGTPIVTSMGDEEAKELFSGCTGIFMTCSDQEAEEAIKKLSCLNQDKKEQIKTENIRLSKLFNWNEIAIKLLKDYGVVE